MAEEENPEDTPEDDPGSPESDEDSTTSDEPDETARPESESEESPQPPDEPDSPEAEEVPESAEEPTAEQPTPEELMEMTVEGDEPESPEDPPGEQEPPSEPKQEQTAAGPGEEQPGESEPEEEIQEAEEEMSEEELVEGEMAEQAEESAREGEMGSPADPEEGADPEQPEESPEEEGGEASEHQGETGDEDLEEAVQPEEQGPDEETEELSTEEERDPEAGEGSEEPVESEGDSGSIQDMLQEESQRVQEQGDVPESTEETEEEQLPGGYLTVDQLPEEEEFTVPDWLKYGGYSLLGVFFLYLSTSFLLLPLWENYHVMQIQTAVENRNYQQAEDLTDRGMILGGLLVHYPDQFVADYLKSLLDAGRYDQFQRVYQGYNEAGIRGPRIDQMYTQFLLNQGKWQEALPRTERLQTQTNTEVRGLGYLFRARALLKLGRLDGARSNLDQARIWLSDHPEVVRLERDLLIARGDFERARTIATDFRSRVSEQDGLEQRVRDFVQLARIYANLDRHQVTEDMLSQALSLDPRHRVAMRELTFRYILQDRWQRAESFILGQENRGGYRKLYPNEPFGWWAEAEFRLSREDYGQAIPLLERGYALNPRNPEIHRVFGRLYLDRLDAPQQATRFFETARGFGLDRLTFIEMMARSYYESGQFGQAAEEYETLMKNLDGNPLKLTYNLGSSLLGAGEYDRAESLLEDAFDSGYRNTNIYNQRGLVAELQGDPVDAQAIYLEGIQWGTINDRSVQILRRNLDRSLAGEPIEPLVDWVAPVDEDLDIPYWLRLDQDKKIGGL